MNGDLIDLVQNLGQPRVLVVGDVMLDRYIWGDAARISQELQREMLGILEEKLSKADVVLVSDYDKGVCTPGLMIHLIEAARRHGVRVVADPIRGDDYRKYHGCSTITPNRLEAGLATHQVLHTVQDAMQAGIVLREMLD